MNEPGAENPLVGRGAERSRIAALVAGLPGRGGALYVEGEAGVGKTVLLATAVRDVPDGVRVLRVTGTESEVVLPFAGVADLVRPLAAHLDTLPAVQRSALGVALALEPGPPPGPLAVCAAVLNLLTAAGAEEPLLVVVDDHHWLDAASQQVLAFVARRLAAEPVVMLFAARPRPGMGAGIPGLPLGGLSVGDCAAMLRARDLAVAPGTLASVVTQCDGNPLAVLETVAASGGAGSGPTGGVRAGWAARLAELPERARRALVVVAAAREPRLDAVERVLRALGLGVADLVPAEEEGLVRAGSVAFVLRHPLLRQVVLDAAPLATRLTVYRAFADGTDGTEHAWYRAAACLGPDDEVAALLVAAAEEARHRTGYSASARTWLRAAELTDDPATRAGRYLRAASDALAAGELEPAARWADEAAAAVADPLVAADAILVRGQATAWMGHLRRARGDLVRAAGAVRPLDPGRAAALYVEAASVCQMDADSGGILDAARAAEDLSGADGPPALPLLACLLSAHVLCGHTGTARGQLAAAAALLPVGDAIVTSAFTAVHVVQAFLHLERFEEANALFGRLVDGSRRTGVATPLPVCLGARAELDWWTGLWASAYADATEALQWGGELHQIGTVGYSLTLLARLDAARGDTASARRRLDRVRAEVGPFGVGSMDLYVPCVAGFLALTLGEHDVAVEALEPAWRIALRTGLRCARAVPFVPDLAEAHVRLGNRARAAELVAWLEDVAETSSLVYPAVAAARLRGLMATDVDTAQAAFARARDAHRRCPMPFEQARTLLCEGEVLRRARQPAAARPVLREAHAIFRSLGARPWADRAEQEITATGARPDRGAGAALDVLTPQEYQVARSVAAGLNNAEVGAMLYLSGKTVEGHLTRVYRKLGVRSRVELATRFHGEDPRAP